MRQNLTVIIMTHTNHTTVTNDTTALPDVNALNWTNIDQTVIIPSFNGYSGPTGKASQLINWESSPSDFFSLFMNTELFQLVCDQTNLYASQAESTFSTTVDELMIFWGLNMLMGVVQKPSIRMYWSNDEIVSTPIFSKTD